MDLTQKAKATKANINTWDSIKLKSFCTIKEIINKMRRQPIEQEKIRVNHILNKGLTHTKNIRNSGNSIANKQKDNTKNG